MTSTLTLDQLRPLLGKHYVVERELGSGGMAVVYLARDRKHDRAVAIKVVRPEIAAALGAARFLREIRITAHLQHPNIVTLIDSGEAAGSLYYVMPYVEGETLRARLKRDGRLGVAEAARILRDVLDALARAHQQGIVHRDIKPENIMLSGRHALVMDFGVAKAITAAADDGAAASGTASVVGLAIGTPTYMSPEQCAGERTIDARSDLYSVGIMAYEMLSGNSPFAGATPQQVCAGHVLRAPASLSAIRPDLPGPLAQAVMRCLEKEPADRWPSAEALLAQIEPFTSPPGATRASVSVHRGRARHLAFATAGLAIVATAALLWLGPGRRIRDRQWAREKGLPQLLALGEAGNWQSAYSLARKLEAIIPGDSLFNALLPRFVLRVSLHTDPAGALVWHKAYEAPESAWTLLGRTPLNGALLPASASGWTNSNRIRIAAPGRRTLDLIGLPFGDSVHLDRDTDLPRGMVRVAGGDDYHFPAGFTYATPVEFGDFLMDRFEVTNREFKRFVDSGGYRRRELWDYPFVRQGRSISWEQAMAAMTDRTGRPGPATWEGGDYPPDQAEFPVAGVSWYEAAAYAKFAGKALPTVFHWNRAAGQTFAPLIVSLSNFSGRGPAKVGSYRGISEFGIYDMAGNVREWCLNATGDQRFILGGGWNDQPYMLTDAFAQLPFDRTPTNGIRLVKYLRTDSGLARAGEPLTRITRDFLAERPVPDALFAAYRQMYDYDRTPLKPKVLESVDEGDWARELIAVDAAYGSERLLIYLYLPKRGTKPFPTVIYFPAIEARGGEAPRDLQRGAFDFMLKTGRAVVYPVYKGTYQRNDSLNTDTPTRYRDAVVMWAKDMRRAIDYSETRSDLRTDRLAYYGYSWGGPLGGLMPAVEPRIKVSILVVAGLEFTRVRPEVDPINFLPRITIPTLMINGRYDFGLPLESSQIPMFRLLGTPPGQKRHAIEDASHFVSRTRLIGESLAWLDRYQPLARQ